MRSEFVLPKDYEGLDASERDSPWPLHRVRCALWYASIDGIRWFLADLLPSQATKPLFLREWGLCKKWAIPPVAPNRTQRYHGESEEPAYTPEAILFRVQQRLSTQEGHRRQAATCCEIALARPL